MRVGHGHFQAFLHRFNLIDDPYCDCGEPNGPSQSVEHVLLRCPRFTAHRIDASEASPVPVETPLFLHIDKAVDQLVRFIRDSNMGTRRDRLWREALRNGEEEDGPDGQSGEERPEDGVNEQDWERDQDEEWLFEWLDNERGEEEDIAGEGEAGDAVEVEEI
jgi:hypothetical protein